MELIDLIKSVKEEKLSKEQLEAYQDQLSSLFAQMQLEMAEKEKEEAIFMNGKGDNESAIARKIAWKATQSGLRLLTLKRYSLATKELLNSLKSRIYRLLI